jgi:predicted outer membrane repeat protein
MLLLTGAYFLLVDYPLHATGNTLGRIANNGGALSVTNSTISDDSAGNSSDGDGASIYDIVMLTVTKSTFLGNSSDVGGGAIYSSLLPREGTER